MHVLTYQVCNNSKPYTCNNCWKATNFSLYLTSQSSLCVRYNGCYDHFSTSKVCVGHKCGSQRRIEKVPRPSQYARFAEEAHAARAYRAGVGDCVESNRDVAGQVLQPHPRVIRFLLVVVPVFSEGSARNSSPHLLPADTCHSPTHPTPHGLPAAWVTQR